MQKLRLRKIKWSFPRGHSYIELWQQEPAYHLPSLSPLPLCPSGLRDISLFRDPSLASKLSVSLLCTCGPWMDCIIPPEALVLPRSSWVYVGRSHMLYLIKHLG